MRGLGLLVLRFAIGIVFVIHGLPRLVPVWETGPVQASALLEAAGVSSAYPVSVATGIVEVVAGFLLILGAYTSWVSVLLTATTALTSWVLNVPNGFLNWTSGSGVADHVEFEFLQVATLVCLMLTGPGVLSYDTRRARMRASKKSQKAEAKRSKT
jgi:uncharacterized membrane protein YphA (DoxX/SURF4 family)